MSTNRDEAVRLYSRYENGHHENGMERAKLLLMFEISDSLAEIAEELRKINRVKDSPQ